MKIDDASGVFVLVAVMGGFVIFGLKSVSGLAGIVGVTVFSCIAIAGYGFLLHFCCDKIPQDQIGDNCYYLGFIYTISSLAAAMFCLNSDDFEISDLVSDFGIALFSTLTGIICRVVFLHNSMKQSSDSEQREMERFVRMVRELSGKFAAAASEFSDLQKKMKETKEGFADFSQKYVQALEAMNLDTGKLKDDLRKNLDNSAAMMNDLYGKGTEALENFNTQISSFSKAMSGMETLENSMEKFVKVSPILADEVEKLQETYRGLNRNQTEMLEEIKKYNAEFLQELDTTKENFNNVAETTVNLLQTAVNYLDK
ncbi:MAG: hypothetical protein J5781_04215 [Clostridia bacterium]|nr:hypothetical protein [Clostridia bacterium]